MYSFHVEGLPAPQGSKTIAKGGGKVWLRDANAKRLAPWRDRVKEAAARVAAAYDCPVEVFAVFYLPRPRKPRWWAPAVSVGDLDKLVRALNDGLEAGGMFADDARVVDLHAFKRYETEANPVGVRVVVVEATEGEPIYGESRD